MVDVDCMIIGEDVVGELKYVYDVLVLIKKQLVGWVLLIGFAGVLWIIFVYMIEGGGSKIFLKVCWMLFCEFVLVYSLFEKIIIIMIVYFKLKVQYGVDFIQLFDFWAGIFLFKLYNEFVLLYLGQIVVVFNEEVFVIFFVKDVWYVFEGFVE